MADIERRAEADDGSETITSDTFEYDDDGALLVMESVSQQTTRTTTFHYNTAGVETVVFNFGDGEQAVADYDVDGGLITGAHLRFDELTIDSVIIYVFLQRPETPRNKVGSWYLQY